MMKTVKEAISLAEKYEAFHELLVYLKSLKLWAILGSVGSLLSYELVLISQALEIENEKMGLGLLLLWTIIVAFWAYEYLVPLSASESSQELGRSEVLVHSKLTDIFWTLAFPVSFPLVYLVSLFLYSVTLPYLVAIVIANAIGHVGSYFSFKNVTSLPLFVGIALLLGSIPLALVNEYHAMILFGFIVGGIYYLASLRLQYKVNTLLH